MSSDRPLGAARKMSSDRPLWAVGSRLHQVGTLEPAFDKPRGSAASQHRRPPGEAAEALAIGGEAGLDTESGGLEVVGTISGRAAEGVPRLVHRGSGDVQRRREQREL